MNDRTPTYEELERRLANAEGALKALRDGQVDTIAGEHGTMVVRLAEAEARADHIKQVLQTIRNVNQLIISEDDPKQLIELACSSLTRTTGYYRASIVLLTNECEVATVVASSRLNESNNLLDEQFRAGMYTHCMSRALDQDEIIVVKDPTACVNCSLSTHYDGHSGLSRRLHHGGKTYGILSVAVPSTYAYDQEALSLFEEVAGNLAFGLRKIKAAKKLSDNQVELKRAQSMAQLGSWRFDLQTGKVIASEEARNIYGVGNEELTIETIRNVPLPQYKGDLDVRLKKLIRKGTPYDVEFQIRRPSNDAIHYIHSVAEYDAERDSVLGTIQDITLRKRTEEALRASERLLAQSQQIAHVGSWVLDVTANHLSWSDETYRIFGLEPQKFSATYESFLDLVHPKDRLTVNAAYSDSIRRKQDGYEIEHQIIRKKNSEVRDVYEKCIHERNSEGEIIRSIGIVQDITDRRRAEDALREREDFLNTILDTTVDGFWVIDSEGVITDVNEVYCSLSGYTREEILGLRINDIDADETPVQTQGRIHRIISNNSELFETCHRRKDGSVFPVEIATSYINKGGGKFVCFARDLSDRKRAEEALRGSNRLLKATFSSMMDAIFILDSEAIVMDCNSAAANIFGYSREEMLGGTVDWLHVEPGSLENFRQHLAAGMAEKGLLHLSEFTMKQKDGTIFPTEHSVMPLEDDHGEKIGWVSVVRDITERKRAEVEHEKLQVQLHQAQKMESVGRLAGGVAHDFNNMLGVILGHTEMALEEVDPAVPIYDSLQAVQHAAERSADLTRQLLAFARKQTVAPKVIDLNETVEGMLRMLRQLIGEDIDLLWQPGRKLQPVKVDPAQIDQLLANLCVNARDAIVGVGKITIETDAKIFDEDYCTDHLESLPGEYVLLEVSDDGCGMDKKTLKQIFEPFFTTKEMGKGTGLGLASVFGMVKQNNGLINVYSEPGQGTTFKIYLPACAIQSDGVMEKAPALPTERGNETILLVEDESTILEMTTMMLERLGYTVVAANTPGEAIRLAHQYRGRIDLLMTDVVMPKMNGRELAGNLLSHYPDLRRLFMSGYTANVIAHHGVLDEGVHFIQKPFSMKDLGGKLREALEG